MKKDVFALVGAMFFVLGMVSCRQEKPNDDEVSIGKGVFVLNEGTYTFANSSLTFYDYEFDTVANELFYKANAAPIGDVGQSLAMVDGKLYIVVNNSNYIYKVDANTLKVEGKIDNFYSPREMLAVAPNKAYVSDLMGTGLWIVNPIDMSHCGSVELGKSTESIVCVGNELYVGNWSNYYTTEIENNTVQVVDIVNDTKVAEIVVGKEPNSMAVDKYDRVWVLCSGGYLNTEKPVLCCIDPTLKQVVKRHEFDGGYPTCYPTNLTIDGRGERLYFIDKDVYALSVDDESLPDKVFVEVTEGGTLYNLAVEPKSGDVYVADAKDYMQNGMVYRYSSDGVLLRSFEAGIIPHAMVFN